MALGPDGNAVEGIWLEAFDEGSYVGRDGAFELSVPEGWVGSSILSVYADEVADCGLVGYYGPGGFTTLIEDATVEIGGIGATVIEIRLQANPDELCRRQSMITGTVLGPDGEPVEGIWIELAAEAFWRWALTGQDGSFEIGLLKGWSGWSALSIEVPGCGLAGYYDEHGGLTPLPGDATRVELGDADVTGIEIRLSDNPDELCGSQSR